MSTSEDWITEHVADFNDINVDNANVTNVNFSEPHEIRSGSTESRLEDDIWAATEKGSFFSQNEADVVESTEEPIPMGTLQFETFQTSPHHLTFSSVYQRQSTIGHGRGGRTRRVADEVRRRYVPKSKAALCNVLCKLYTTPKACATRIFALLSDIYANPVSGPILISLTTSAQVSVIESVENLLEKYSKQDRKGVEAFYAPTVVLCAHFSSRTRPSDGQGIHSMIKERHAACTWIDHDGHVRCTCIGLVDYRIKDASNDFHYNCCHHAHSINTFLTDLGTLLHTRRDICGKALRTSVLERTEDMDTYKSDLPMFVYLHSGSIAILALNHREEGGDELRFVPIRCIRRNIHHYICAFCDLGNTATCEHVLKLRDLIVHGGPAELPTPGITSISLEKQFGPDWNPMDDLGGISEYPVCIVDCSKALRMDRKIMSLSQSKEALIVKAPVQCTSCTSARLEESRKIQKGVIMSSGGVGDMHVEVFKCSNCDVPVHSEGRDYCIAMLSLSTAGSHVLLRSILRGVVTSNGTIKGRLEQYLSAVTARIDADLIPGQFLRTEQTSGMSREQLQVKFRAQMQLNFEEGLLSEKAAALWRNTMGSSSQYRSGAAPVQSAITYDEDAGWFGEEKRWRSSRTLHKLCMLMTKLMVMSPSPTLFKCGTCEEPSGRLYAVCTDGIWSGYQKRLRRKFVNVSESCEALKPSTALPSSRAPKRPIAGLLRKDQTGIMLIAGMKGSTEVVTTRTLTAVIGAIRVVSPDILPPTYMLESITGRSPKENDDVGFSVLSRLRLLITTCFNATLLSRRLCQNLLQYMTKTRRGARPVRKGRKRSRVVADTITARNAEIGNDIEGGNMDSELINILISFLASSNVDEANHQDNEIDGLCWNVSFRNTSLGAGEQVARNDLFMFLRSLIQSPCIQMVKRNQTDSLREIASVCGRGRQAVLDDLADKCGPNHLYDSESGVHIIRNLRVMRGGLLAAAEFEFSCPGLLKCIGDVLMDVSSRVESFYSFYESLSTQRTTAGKFAAGWSAHCFQTLRRKFLSDHPLAEKLEGSMENHYVSASRTGVFFPAHPQVRPMPFNDELKNANHMEAFGVCSKSYIQGTKSFTPGALTFLCSCSTPIIMGFKVLEKNEGPRAVMDVIVSRFAQIPRHIIYDFACGLYSCAVHTLWWALEDTTVVSDNLHSRNHTCSPTFIPTSHDSLNMVNTVAHEQRNSSITQMQDTLRAMAQESYIALLAYQACILNLKAKTTSSPEFERRKEQAADANHLEWSYFHCLKLKCPCCN